MSDLQVKKIQTYSLFGFGLVTIILWNIPGLSLVLYPFTLLGTWFHEMAHGIAAILMGGSFQKLVIFPDGSGYAQFAYTSLFLGGIGKSIVAAAGPVGPTIAGSLFIIASINKKSTEWALYIFSFLLILSSLIWVRPLISWGFLIVLFFAVSATLVSVKASINAKIMTLQFLAVQAFISVYQSIGYLYSTGASVDGSPNMSDTQVIADNLFLPYWFWATLLLAFNVWMIYVSLKYYFKKNESGKSKQI
ncbi:MAG: M50 family metallopeptidase [Candidatus Kapabacteria bacterium]|nr:M50 family metallopeptidase [Ignavibacteriota bacterium]MCW5883986.1 M50 family metallopeptidase [Candidatus Kapabacteria bacterium]